MRTNYTMSMVGISSALSRVSIFHRNRDRMRSGVKLAARAENWRGSRAARKRLHQEHEKLIGAARYVASHSFCPRSRREALDAIAAMRKALCLAF